MNLILNDIWLAIAVLSVIAFSILLIVLILILYRSLKIREAFWIAVKSDRICEEIGKDVCEQFPRNDLPLSSSMTVTYDYDTARYALDLVLRLELNRYPRGQRVHVPFVLPPDQRMVTFLVGNPSLSPLGAMTIDGNGTLWISFRGTETMTEDDLLTGEGIFDIDLEQNPVRKEKNYKQAACTTLFSCPLPSVRLEDRTIAALERTGPKVHQGFLTLYEKVRTSLHRNLLHEVSGGSVNRIVISGHSLGGAMASIASYDLAIFFASTRRVTYTFGTPRVGNIEYAQEVNRLVPRERYFRVENEADVVKDVPPSTSPNFDDPTKPFEYQHAGTMVSYEGNWKSLRNSHKTANYIVNLPR